MTWSRPLLPLLLAAALLGAPTGVTEAASVSLTFEQLTDASDYVVRGTVRSLVVEADDRGVHWTRVELDVERVLKGPAGLDHLRLDVIGGFQGAEGTWVREAPAFGTGEPVLVFAEVLESGLTVPTGLEQGKFTVRVAPEDGREMLVRFKPGPGVPYRHDFIPHPAPADRLYLDDLVSRVERRVATGWDGQPIPGKSTQRLEAMHRGEVTR